MGRLSLKNLIWVAFLVLCLSLMATELDQSGSTSLDVFLRRGGGGRSSSSRSSSSKSSSYKSGSSKSKSKSWWSSSSSSSSSKKKSKVTWNGRVVPRSRVRTYIWVSPYSWMLRDNHYNSAASYNE